MSLVTEAATGVARFFSPGVSGAVVRTALRNAMKTSPTKVPNAPSAAVTTQDRGMVGKPNVALFRNWAEHSEWVRAAINIRRDQVAQAEWFIEPIDNEARFNKERIAQITDLLTDPNPIDISWQQFIARIVEDLLVLDAGCIEKERTLSGGIANLYPVDGGQIRVNRYWDGDPAEARYAWYPDYQERARFRDDELIYMMANPMTYRVVGLAPLETLKLAVDAELSGQNYNTRQVKAPAPDGLLDLGEQARPDQVEDFKRYWNAEVAGKGAMAFLGGSRGAQFLPFRTSNRDMQFLEYQIYLMRKIAAVFGLSAQDLGMPIDVNRATAQVQADNTEDRGLRPLLGLVQTFITREVVQDAAFGGKRNNLAFKFTALNLKESMDRAQINRYALAGMPWKVVDEARVEAGYPPLGGTLGNSLMAMGSKGPVRFAAEEDIPTAREALEAGSKPAPPTGSSSSKDWESVPELTAYAGVSME
jgi:HK97 family phage portal protein